MIQKFKSYVSSFEKNKRIDLKYSHSLRVMIISEDLARGLNLTEEEVNISKFIGLMHDYGRFYQWNKYNTFDDSISFDHADYGAKLLFDDGDINNYDIDYKYYDIIYDAIRYHNKYSIGDEVKDRLQCEIIRDSDKLDIMYMYTAKILKLKEDGKVSSKVNEDFFNHKLIIHKYKKSSYDVIVGILSFIYDMNFIQSFEYLYCNDIIYKIYNLLDDKEKMKIYFDEANNYIKERMLKKC